MVPRKEALKQAFARHAIRRSLILAILVGTLLNLIGQGDLLAAGRSLDWWKILLTYAVPFAVASYGTYSAILHASADAGLPISMQSLPALGVEVSTDKSRLDVEIVQAMLRQSYWSLGIPAEVVSNGIRNSLCVGAYERSGTQIGFARLATDYATFAYLCDVMVDEAWRGKGIETAMVSALMEQPFVGRLRRI